MNQMMKCAFCGLAAAFGLSVGAATMTPFDDCVWWFEGGVLTAGETSRMVTTSSTDLFDLTHASTPDGETHQTTKVGAAANMVITNMEVICPCGGMVVTQSVLRVSNDKQADDKYYPPTCTLPAVVRGNFTKTSAVTIVGRVRVASSVEGNSNRIAYLFDFGYMRDGSMEYYGFPCGFQSNGAGSVGQYYWTRLNDSQSEGTRNSTLFKLDQWVDVAWVFKDGYVAYAYCTTNSTDVKWFEKTDSIAHFGQGGDSLYLFRGNSAHMQGAVEGTANLFKGDIARLAIWNRELSKDEIEYAFVYGGKWQHVFGLQNGSDAEFGGTTALKSADETMSWKTMLSSGSPKLASGESFTYTFSEPKSADAGGATAREMVVSLALTSESAAGTLEVRANGTACKTIAVTPGEVFAVVVPAKHLQASATKSVENTISLVRTDNGDGFVCLDVLDFTKGWQVGYADGRYKDLYDSTLNNSATYSLMAHDGWREEEQLVNASQRWSACRTFSFFVPPLVAQTCPTVYTFAKCQEFAEPVFVDRWCITGLTMLVNGEIAKAVAYVDDQAYLAQTYTVVLPPGTLKSGYNTVGVAAVYDSQMGDRGWFFNDYFRFEFKKPSEGLMLLLR